MTRLISAAGVAAAVLAATAGAAAQGPRPGEPNPADRGGEFTISGCVQQEAAQQGSPTVYKITRVSPATGEGRAVSAMGAGVPVAGANASAKPPSDPPDIVSSEYRIVATEQLNLPKYVNQTVEARGTLRDAPAASAGSAASSRGSNNATAASGRAVSKVFMATALNKLADTCTEVKGN